MGQDGNKIVPLAPVKGRRQGKPPGRGRRALTKADTKRILELRVRHGLTHTEIAERMGCTPKTVQNHLHKADREGIEVLLSDTSGERPKVGAQVSAEAKARLENFRDFRWHYFRRETPNFQLAAAEHVDTLEPDDATLILWPPGHGKSWLWTHDYPIYAMVRARTNMERFAMLIVSKTEDMAKAFMRRIAKTLEGHAELIADFGGFKPEYDVWRADALQVAGFDHELQGKEPSYIAGAYGSQIYGWRVTHILCDDLVDKSNSALPTQTDRLEEWFSEELVSRMDEGARLIVPGTRFSAIDLYGRLLRKRDEDSELLFKRMVLPAHDPGKCSGVSCRCNGACEHHPEWPEGCLLWPDKFGMKRMKRIRAQMRSSTRFEFIYNQVEAVEADALVSGEDWELAKDQGRTAWHIPPSSQVVCTLDPAPDNWSVFQAWAYRRDLDVYSDSLDGPVAGVSRFAVAMERRKGLSASEYLTILRAWTDKVRAKGFEPIWIVELNSQQKWLSQFGDFLRLKTELGITVIPHSTNRNKLDPEFGVRVLKDVYGEHKVSIPWGDLGSQEMFTPLGIELTTYPHSETTDAVMANWFFEHRISRNVGTMTSSHAHVSVPPWMLRNRALIDPRNQQSRKVGV